MDHHVDGDGGNPQRVEFVRLAGCGGKPSGMPTAKSLFVGRLCRREVGRAADDVVGISRMGMGRAAGFADADKLPAGKQPVVTQAVAIADAWES